MRAFFVSVIYTCTYVSLHGTQTRFSLSRLNIEKWFFLADYFYAFGQCLSVHLCTLHACM